MQRTRIPGSAKEICGTFSAKLPTVISKEGKTQDDNCQVKERWKEHFNDLYYTQNPVIDYRQAFNSIRLDGLWAALRNYGILEKLVALLEYVYNKSISAVRVDKELAEWFRVTVGVQTRLQFITILV